VNVEVLEIILVTVVSQYNLQLLKYFQYFGGDRVSLWSFLLYMRYAPGSDRWTTSISELLNHYCVQQV
jgi:hypothetical protein